MPAQTSEHPDATGSQGRTELEGDLQAEDEPGMVEGSSSLAHWRKFLAKQWLSGNAEGFSVGDLGLLHAPYGSS